MTLTINYSCDINWKSLYVYIIEKHLLGFHKAWVIHISILLLTIIIDKNQIGLHALFILEIQLAMKIYSVCWKRGFVNQCLSIIYVIITPCQYHAWLGLPDHNLLAQRAENSHMISSYLPLLVLTEFAWIIRMTKGRLSSALCHHTPSNSFPICWSPPFLLNNSIILN